VCNNCSGFSDRIAPPPATSSARKSAESTEEYPDDPKPAEGGDLQMEYSDYFFCQSIEAVTKKLPVRTLVSRLTV
jgi:hypothetical protein